MVPQTSKTVLLAEDEDGLRRLLTAVLTSLGVSLLVAVNGAEALRKAQHYRGRIDLLVSNIQMLEMRGIELVQRLSGEHPEIKVVLMSGSPNQALALSDGWCFMQRPFVSRDFIAAITAMLDGQQTLIGSLDQPDQPGEDQPGE